MKYPKFTDNCHSLLCKFLTKEVFEELKERKTSNGFTLSKAINSGVVNEDSGIGVYAGDEESYTLFAPLFDPIIKEYHGFGSDDIHLSNFDPKDLDISNPDPQGKYILSTRIRVGRNLADFPLGTIISKTQRDKVESLVSNSLKSLKGELKGSYYPLKGMSKDVREMLIKDHFLFKEGDRFLEAAGLNRDWPDGRGIYHNDDKTFLVWINEEDELRIISMQQGGDIKEVFTRLSKAVTLIEQKASFMKTKHLGYITSCPTNLGTAMRASVHIKLPKLSRKMDIFEEITKENHLQIRGIHGEHSQDESGIFDISNKRRLGISEVQCAYDLFNGVKKLIEKESSL